MFDALATGSGLAVVVPRVAGETPGSARGFPEVEIDREVAAKGRNAQQNGRIREGAGNAR